MLWGWIFGTLEDIYSVGIFCRKVATVIADSKKIALKSFLSIPFVPTILCCKSDRVGSLFTSSSVSCCSYLMHYLALILILQKSS